MEHSVFGEGVLSRLCSLNKLRRVVTFRQSLPRRTDTGKSCDPRLLCACELNCTLFEYDSITVSYAWELLSVSMCYSQGDGFNTSWSRLCTEPTTPLSYLLFYLLALRTECLGLCIVLGIVAGGMIMCYPGQR